MDGCVCEEQRDLIDLVGVQGVCVTSLGVRFCVCISISTFSECLGFK